MEERPSPIAYAIGGLLPIAVAGAMVGLRDEVDNTNVALLLVLVVVGTAAFGGRGPAALSAVIAAVSFQFFFTQPVLLVADRQLERHRDRRDSPGDRARGRARSRSTPNAAGAR